MDLNDDMEAAPKDRDILLLLPGDGAHRKPRWSVGTFDDDKYAQKPRPYWRAEIARTMGSTWMRGNQPVAWMDLPPITTHHF